MGQVPADTRSSDQPRDQSAIRSIYARSEQSPALKPKSHKHWQSDVLHVPWMKPWFAQLFGQHEARTTATGSRSAAAQSRASSRAEENLMLQPAGAHCSSSSTTTSSSSALGSHSALSPSTMLGPGGSVAFGCLWPPPLLHSAGLPHPIFCGGARLCA